MDFPILSVDRIPDRRYQCLGTVFEQEIVGLSIYRDFFAKFRDLFGGRVRNYDQPIRAAMHNCITRLKQRTHDVGGNGIIGLSISISALDFARMAMLQVVVYGTAIRLDEPDASPSQP